MTTVCWLYVHSLGFFNSYIDLNQYAQDNEKAHFSTASFVFKESKYDLSVYPPEIRPLVHKDLHLRTVSIFANQIVNISIYINEMKRLEEV